MNTTLRSLLEELQRDLSIVEGLDAAQEARHAIEQLREDLEAQLGRVQGAAVITLVGATGAGKSSLLNALVGADVATPGVTRPTTSAPVVYRPRDADVGQLLADLPGKPPRVVDYLPELGGTWSEQILIDAPDTNSVATEHRDVVRGLAEHSDVLVVVVHRQSVAELAAADFIDDFAGRRGLVFVLGRADELTEEGREALVTQLRELAQERWGQAEPSIHVLSPLQARQEKNDEWLAFEAELAGLVQGGRLGSVRRHNALGTLGQLQVRLSELAEVGRPALGQVEQELESGLRTWSERVQGLVEQRLALRAPDLAHLLWNEVGRRWDGPGGLAVRAGGLAAMGLGAGALLARRNPLLAAGAAATAVVADRAGGALQQRAFQDAGGLLPGPGELRAIESEVLGPARLAAKSAGPVALAPAVDRLGACAAEAVGEAWSGLLEQDVPTAAERSAPAWLRFPVDLPVYGFGAWIVYCAGRGFWSGDYVGLDFLVNATLLLGAWLFLARTCVRRWLGRRAAGLLAGVRLSLGQRLDGAARELARAHGEERDRLLGALERMEGLELRWGERLGGKSGERARRSPGADLRLSYSRTVGRVADE